MAASIRSTERERPQAQTMSAGYVEHLPTTNRWHGFPRSVDACGRPTPQNPRQELGRRAPSGDGVARRRRSSQESLNDLYVGSETSASEDTFDQIVAEQRLNRAPGQREPPQRRLRRRCLYRYRNPRRTNLDIHRKRPRLGIDASDAGKNALKHRTLPTNRQRGRDPRLDTA